MISCIIPCYCSESSIATVVEELRCAFKKRSVSDYEIILVNDSSPDGVFGIIRELCNIDRRIKAIDLAKNFGQHNAIMAGINHAGGDILVLLDDDGQTPASEVWKLIDSIDGDCDIVFARYEEKKHSKWRNVGSKVNDFMAEILIGKPKNLNISAYVACKRFVAEEIKRYNGNSPYMSGLLLRTSSKIKNVLVTHHKRESGKSNYSLKKLLSLWLSGFISFSVKPLRIATFLGFIIALIGFTSGSYILIRRLLNPDIPMGWSSTMAVLLFIGGIIMVMMGLLGEYIGRVYINLNNAPQYVIRESIGFDGDENKITY